MNELPDDCAGKSCTDKRIVAFANFTQQDVDRFWSKVDVKGPDDCWLWTSRHVRKKGYGVFKAQGQDFISSRIALALQKGALPDSSLFACHTCDNPPCCNPAHLWWGTSQDNARDAFEKGRYHKWAGERCGDSNPKAILTLSDVTKIRQDKRFQREIAASYGVSQSAISDIMTGRTWSNFA